MTRFKLLRELAGMFLLLFALLSAPASQAMDHTEAHAEPMYSYTRAELATGQVRHQPGAARTLALDGWYGGDKDRLWWQGDAASLGGKQESSALGIWYGHYCVPFWDGQIGLRSDGNPGSAGYLSVGMRGLAPYEYDTDFKLDVRSDGKWFVHGKVEQDVLLTNRLILSPSLDVSFAGSDVDATVRSGLYQAGIGVHLRYEFTRKFAPYLEASRTLHPRALAAGEPHSTRIMAGLRLVF